MKLTVGSPGVNLYLCVFFFNQKQYFFFFIRGRVGGLDMKMPHCWNYPYSQDIFGLDLY